MKTSLRQPTLPLPSNVFWAILFMAVPAFADVCPSSTDYPMYDVLCCIVDWFNGNLGRGLATIGVSAVAIGAIFGKVSWGLALTVIIGVIVMFGAGDILDEIGIIDGTVC